MNTRSGSEKVSALSDGVTSHNCWLCSGEGWGRESASNLFLLSFSTASENMVSVRRLFGAKDNDKQNTVSSRRSSETKDVSKLNTDSAQGPFDAKEKGKMNTISV